MRSLEIILVLADILIWLAWTAPLPRRLGWMRHLAPVGLLVAAAQALAEGPRAALFPAYALTGLFCLVWGLRLLTPTAKLAGRTWIRRLGDGLGTLGLVVSAALPVVLPVFRFPTPSGSYGIGTLTYHWVDADRQEIFSDDPNARRELVVQVWYPAEREASARRAPYLPDAEPLAAVLAQTHHQPQILFRSLKYVSTHAIPSAPVAAQESSYPLLIFLEGLTGFRQMNTFQVEELVSHGYIVAAIDQPDEAALVVFPDGRQAVMPPLEQIQALVHQSYRPVAPAPLLNGKPLPEGIIPYFAQDVIFTLDKIAGLNQADPKGILTGRLDLQRSGVFGMSGGGIVAGEACRLDPRLRACLILDAPMPTNVVQAGLQQPSMWITRDAGTMRLERQRAGGWSEADIQEHLTSMRAVFASLPGDGYFVQVPGMFHIDFTDVPSWTPLVRWLGAAGPVGVERAHAIVNAYSLAFFDRHLKGLPQPLLAGPSAQFPEVILETRQP